MSTGELLWPLGGPHHVGHLSCRAWIGIPPKAPFLGGHLIPILTACPHQGSSAQGRRAGQHDHGSEGAPVPGGIRHLLACIREFHPKEATACGLSHTATPQTGRFLQTGGYVLPREHPRHCQNG